MPFVVRAAGSNRGRPNDEFTSKEEKRAVARRKPNVPRPSEAGETYRSKARYFPPPSLIEDYGK